jgi:hypothetical protein
MYHISKMRYRKIIANTVFKLIFSVVGPILRIQHRTRISKTSKRLPHSRGDMENISELSFRNKSMYFDDYYLSY